MGGLNGFGMSWSAMMLMMVMMAVFSLILLGLAVVAVIAFVRRPGSLTYRRSWGGGDPAMEALRPR